MNQRWTHFNLWGPVFKDNQNFYGSEERMVPRLLV